MKDNIQTLGWWMRRTTGMTLDRIAPFYEEVIGLPRVRDYDHLTLVWAGEDLIFEVKTDDEPTRAQTDPASAACIPVFRTHDIGALRARMASFGYEPVSEQRSAWGRTLFYLGPDKLITGFEARADDSPLLADQEALAAWRKGPARLADLPPLPAGIHYLSRVIRRVADVDTVAAFYRDVLGFDDRGADGASRLFSLGDWVTLEIAPGGAAEPPPADRAELPDSYILRIHEWEASLAEITGRGATFVGDLIVWAGGTLLRYVPDPEGHLTGIEQRGTIRHYLEDIEADKRWAERGRTGP